MFCGVMYLLSCMDYLNSLCHVYVRDCLLPDRSLGFGVTAYLSPPNPYAVFSSPSLGLNPAKEHWLAKWRQRFIIVVTEIGFETTLTT